MQLEVVICLNKIRKTGRRYYKVKTILFEIENSRKVSLSSLFNFLSRKFNTNKYLLEEIDSNTNRSNCTRK